jgi:hypothetical protein
LELSVLGVDGGGAADQLQRQIGPLALVRQDP